MEENRYYIYLWIREDYDTIFYVGKGCDFRATRMQGRNKHFLNIVQSIPTHVIKLYENLTEDEAFTLETETIKQLVYSEGYSIDIKGFSKIKGKHLVNKTWGGEGSSGRKLTDEQKRHLSEIRTGVPNPKTSEAMKEYYKTHDVWNMKKVVCINTGIVYNSIAEADKDTKAGSGGISNCCQGKTLHAGRGSLGEVLVWSYLDDFLIMSEQEIKEKIDHAEKVCSKKGKFNSFYGKEHTNETKQKLRDNWTQDKKNEMISKQKCKSVYCVELNMEFVSQNSASRYINDTYGLKLKGQLIGQHCTKGDKSKGYGEIMINGEMTKLHWKYV